MARRNSDTMRIIHRYLGFFLVGIMAMYSLSGITLIFRNTDFLKKEVVISKTIEPNIAAKQLGQKLKIKGLKITKEKGDILQFEEGTYNKKTGQADYVQKKLPLLVDKMQHLHKANTNSPLFYLNIFFWFVPVVFCHLFFLDV